MSLAVAIIRSRSKGLEAEPKITHAPKRCSRRQAKENELRVSELILTSHCSATRGLSATDDVILNHGQVTWTTPELAPPLLTTTPHSFQLSTDLTCIAALHGGSFSGTK
ncbi:hypothetical protein TNCV_3386211 [Trichonephila clavipes]|nr:hypothetical protein TNCV_3386211 [Trichonephila clavipes]